MSMSAPMPRHACVYTALTGRYEPLGEQPMARGSALPFICFTDDPTLTSETWQIRPIAPLFANDHIRNQRDIKLHPHRHLPEFATSLYIDNSVRLTAPPEDILAAADLATGLCLPPHSFRETLRGEFETVLEHRLDEPARVRELLELVTREAPHLLRERPFWSGVMIRDHRNERVARAMEIWFAHILRHSRRDQLSSLLAFHRAGLAPVPLPIDNQQSSFHTWPHLEGRDAARRLWTEPDPPSPLAARVRALEAQAATLRSENARLSQALAERTTHLDIVLNSTTWRAFAPLRGLSDLFRKRTAPQG
jgi:hypothetical protein